MPKDFAILPTASNANVPILSHLILYNYLPAWVGAGYQGCKVELRTLAPYATIS